MVKNQQIQLAANSHINMSKLERFSLDFEYDKTLQKVKQDIRLRGYQ